GQRLDGKVVIVLDILFATTTIVAALDAGATAVVPALDGAAALALAERVDGPRLLAGELYAETLDGFAPATPLAVLARLPVGGGHLIYATTNGTVALNRAQGAAQVYAASLLNAQAMVDHVARHHPDCTVLLVCSGSADRFNLEDFYGAGYLVSLLRQAGARDFTDAARAAELLHAGHDARACFEQARVGRRMLDKGLSDELDVAARKSISTVVPRLVDGVLRPVEPA
ncbi:MAG TPA: 2-phosphosulfolactate phosphatase, partial [Aquabacterium sp.]|nr:2-phosphosulfolactate phosphatase [Aquabacterium sp.]